VRPFPDGAVAVRVFLLISLFVFAAPSAADAVTDVVARDHALNAAIVANDRASAAAMYADAFVLTTASGRRKSKADMLSEIGNPELVLTRNETTDVEVRVLGDVAVLTGTLHQRGSFRGAPIAATLFVTDTWVLRDGAWVLLSGHASRAP
jgi:ketosteroid isomerase-like protein